MASLVSRLLGSVAVVTARGHKESMGSAAEVEERNRRRAAEDEDDGDDDDTRAPGSVTTEENDGEGDGEPVTTTEENEGEGDGEAAPVTTTTNETVEGGDEDDGDDGASARAAAQTAIAKASADANRRWSAALASEHVRANLDACVHLLSTTDMSGAAVIEAATKMGGKEAKGGASGKLSGIRTPRSGGASDAPAAAGAGIWKNAAAKANGQSRQETGRDALPRG